MTIRAEEVAEEVTEELVLALTRRLLEEFVGSDDRTFFGAQFDLGLWRIDFPPGHGGLGGSPKLQEVVDVALDVAGRRGHRSRNPVGIGMCGPTIAAKGTEEQKTRFLRKIFTAEEIWCQLFSEPGAGSDVASLATRAVWEGDEWVVNGQKVWTSLAHLADWGLLLARTDPDVPKHRGLTAFIIDMHQTGLEVRPLREMTGGAVFNEVFFTNARIPKSLQLGEVGQGWQVANATLMNERVSIGGVVEPQGSGPIADAVEIWRRSGSLNHTWRDRLTKLWIEAEVYRLSNIRAQTLRKKGVPGPEGSVLKLGSALLSQNIATLSVDMLGPAGMLCSGYLTPDSTRNDRRFDHPVLRFVGAQGATIAGGTTEIMRNILGERVLGLPREPWIDPNTPWSRIPRS